MRLNQSRILLFICLNFLVGSGILFSSEHVLDQEAEKSCQACHTEITQFINTTPHKILITQEGKRVKNSPRSCTDCHRIWTEHLNNPVKENIENPARLPAERNFLLCSECHLNPHIQKYSELDVHLRNNIGCSHCHKIHTPRAEHLLFKSPDELCLSCHKNIKAQFLQVSHHPVLEKVIRCIDCHQFLRDVENIISGEGSNQRCYLCHAEFTGPFPFEHGATQDYTIQEGSCSSCHEPHGSSIQKLLKQPEHNLCLQCHLVPGHNVPHTGFIRTDNYIKYNCMECHVDIHGSYRSEYFFDFQTFDVSCIYCHRK
jgi:DmsE family decaheme c-type cytochrome